MRLNFVLGTAAELIKLHPVIREAQIRGHLVQLVGTGQSRENLLNQMTDFQYDRQTVDWLVEDSRDLEKASSALVWFCKAAMAFRRARTLFNDGLVVVHGDTLSTLIGAIHGWRLGRTVVHVEAGLRSTSLLNPFPEEINRRLVSRLARVHMAPDATAAQNLVSASVMGRVANTGGNTLMDTVRLTGPATAGPAFALANLHRFENLNNPARWRALVECVTKAAETRKVIFIAHPQTRHRLNRDPEARSLFEEAGVEVRDRMTFSHFIGLLKTCDFLISDGGSNQEECSYLGKPCLLLRENTERLEGLDSCCVLSRFDPAVIGDFLAHPERFARDPTRDFKSPSRILIEELESL